ncbi:Co-chaperone [Coemansia spiralis]|uniref:Co-chaperone n=2 Tax=Coemansia TaxID=4863 RepID=A0A9W8L1E0_9FUNG|nr:YL1 nuclear protein C-terminal domain-containing protein [Coemansia spiralis]KAJ1996346.1 Co-chaperone [Coemansia umbellata]KAJ2624190.1 Co-chaperone [Coemansia sp. RSA 1358]KAJ2680774.1 Co-chaperone [Coemansia spiralis]
MPPQKRGKRGRPSSAADTPTHQNQQQNQHGQQQQLDLREGKPLKNFKDTGISNLFNVAKPFKNSAYKSNRRWKNLKQIVAQEQQAGGAVLSVDFPTHWNIDAPPSLRPQKKYCDITGLPASYTDPKTNVRYYSAEVYQVVRSLPPGSEQDYLGLRNASVTLK